MKISCLLTSFNRPTLVQQALRSVADQGYKNYELLVIDDSTVMDVKRLVDRHHFPSVRVVHFNVTGMERSRQNRLGVSINAGLNITTGDLICYLSDDDYYYNDWFQNAAEFFRANPSVVTGYGSLTYTQSLHMDFSQVGSVRFPGGLLDKPAGQVDHTQVMHRAIKPRIFWPESLDSVKESDGLFFTELAKHGAFHPMPISASVKRLHSKNLQNHIPELEQGRLDNLRD